MSTDNTETPRVDELKQCPFCDGEAKHVAGYWFDGSWKGDYVRCTNSSCRARNEHNLRVEEPDAIAAWNTRLAHQPANADELVETLYNLSARAGKLVTATDGQEQWRTERQAVLDAMRAALAALSRPLEEGEPVAWIDTEQLAALSVKHDFFPPVSARKMDEFETPLYAHPTAGKVIDEQDVERVAIAKRFKVTRKMEDDPFGKTLPKWTRNLAFGFYREQGWRACDQRKGGKTVATGAWGDELFLLTDGSFACTKYPNGYPSFAALQPSPGALGERGE